MSILDLFLMATEARCDGYQPHALLSIVKRTPSAGLARISIGPGTGTGISRRVRATRVCSPVPDVPCGSPVAKGCLPPRKPRRLGTPHDDTLLTS